MNRAERLLAAYRVVRIFGMLSLAFLVAQVMFMSDPPELRSSVVFTFSLGWFGILMSLCIFFDGIRSLIVFSPLKTVWLSGLLLYLTLGLALFAGGISLIFITIVVIYRTGFII